MVVMVLAWIGLQLLSTWWTNHQLDATYGYPRTYQIDDVVGHGDSTDHPTHFLFENLHGQVVIFELPGGNFQHARIYKGPTLFLDNADLIPVHRRISGREWRWQSWYGHSYSGSAYYLSQRWYTV